LPVNINSPAPRKAHKSYEMKIINLYQCEICSAKYKDEADAIKCEKRGIPDAEKFRPGLLYRYRWDGDLGGIFALAKIYPQSNPHYYPRGGFWACRNWSSLTEGGDNLENGYCSGPDLGPHFNSKITASDLCLPEMERMLAHLKSVGIEPYIMIQGEPHPLSFINPKTAPGTDTGK